MRSLFPLFLLLLLSASVKGQDAHFSQFYANPLYLNPAMTGVFEGQFRFNANYRQQWSSVLGDFPFETYAASFDYRWNFLGNDYIAFGINALQDESGSAIFQQSKGYLSLSVLKQLSGNRRGDRAQFIAASGQVGLAQHRINFDRLTFSNQFDGNSQIFDPSLGSGETPGENSIDYIDFNAGILWYALFGNRFNIYVGGAMMHINRPEISFTNNVEQLHLRYVGHLGGEVGLSPFFSLLPAYIFMRQGQSMEHNIGTNLRIVNNEGYREMALRIGLWWRAVNGINSVLNTDSIILSTMLEYDRWLLGLSYDLNQSRLQKFSNNQGAIELSLSYRHPEKLRYGTVKCPKF